MEFPLLVNKEQKSLTVAPLPSSEGHTARIAGREYRLRWLTINDNEWLLDVDGRQIRTCLAARGGETWISIDGETYLVEEPDTDDRRPRRRQARHLSAAARAAETGKDNGKAAR